MQAQTCGHQFRFDCAGALYGEIGTLEVTGPTVALEYYGAPEKTARTFHGDTLRTEDLFVRDPDGARPVLVVTDLGVLEPDPVSCELTLTRVHPGVTVADAQAATGWKLSVAESLAVTERPTGAKLDLLRALKTGKVP